MDFQSMKRRELQALCKLNNIPANMTNAAMAHALNSLETVNGIEDFLAHSQTGGLESAEKSMATTGRKPSKVGVECSNSVTTRTRCGSRRVAIEGTDTRMTTATRTTRRRATQEASMQAKFEEDLEQSDVSANSGVESTEISDVSIGQRGHIVSRSENEPEHKVPEVDNDGEVVDVGDDKEDMGKDTIVNEAQEELQKLDFHSLGRKDLQNLCKKNKIPANMTNAAMADALGSLDTVEGLQEFLEGYDPLAIKSPETARMTACRVRPARTGRKTTAGKSARAGSALCKSLARKMEDLNEEVDTNEGGMSVEVDKTLQCHLDEECLENSSTINGEAKSVSEEASNEPNSSTDALVTGEELHDEVVENKCDGRDNESIRIEMCDNSEEFEANMSIESDTDNHSAVYLGQEIGNLLETEVKLQDEVSNDQEVEVNISEESHMAESNVDKCSMLDAPEAEINGPDECIEINDKSADTETLESESDTNFSDETHNEGVMQDAPAVAVAIKGFAQLEELSDLEADNEGLEFANEDVRVEEDSVVAEGVNREIEDEYVESGPASDSFSVAGASLCPVTEPEDDDGEPTQASEHAPIVKATPLCHKSLRKLKKLVKEKLQETNLLAKKLEKLTLQDKDIPVGNCNSDVDELSSKTVNGFDDNEEANEDAGEVLSAVAIAEESLDETDGADQQVAATEAQPTESEAPMQASEPLASRKAPKPLVFTTPIKSSSTTPMTAGRTIRVSDANKENINDSAAKTTEAGKIKLIVSSPPAMMSMGKLKKEVKELLLSEKKRPALQSRSDNQCSLTSP